MKNVSCQHPGCERKTRTAYGPPADPMFLCSQHGKTSRRSLEMRRAEREEMQAQRTGSFSVGATEAKILPFRRQSRS